MKIVEDFPREIRVVENVWIPMSDGARLAARMWLPVDAETRPVPALVEAMPNRKRDFTHPRDEPLHSWFAGHGYASLRVDLRGSGDSEGLLEDEYHLDILRKSVDGSSSPVFRDALRGGTDPERGIRKCRGVRRAPMCFAEPGGSVTMSRDRMAQGED